MIALAFIFAHRVIGKKPLLVDGYKAWQRMILEGGHPMCRCNIKKVTK